MSQSKLKIEKKIFRYIIKGLRYYQDEMDRWPTLAELKVFIRVENENCMPISNFDAKVNQAVEDLVVTNECVRMSDGTIALVDVEQEGNDTLESEILNETSSTPANSDSDHCYRYGTQLINILLLLISLYIFMNIFYELYTVYELEKTFSYILNEIETIKTEFEKIETKQ